MRGSRSQRGNKFRCRRPQASSSDGWEWMPWSDIMEMKNKKDLLFEPMINLLDGLGADGEDASNPSFF